MNEVTITGGQLLWILGAIGTAAVAWKYISAPFRQLDQHGREIEAIKRSLERSDDNQRTLMRAVLAMVNHMADGNGVDALRKVREEIQKDLIQK